MTQRSILTDNGRKAARWAIFAACAAVFLTALDQTVVVTALPQMITDLQIPITQLDRAAWIISGYLLGYVVAMPLMGRVSDMYGRRRVFLICLGIFAFGSLFCGLSPMLGNAVDISFLQRFGIPVDSPGLVWLVTARFVQAAGGGAIVPVAMAVAGDFYGEQRRAMALGLVGLVTEAGGVLGPLYGSIIVQTWGWQAIFYLNIPIVAVLIFFIWRLVPASTHLQERIDIPGALLLGASLVCLSLGLSQEAAQISPAKIAPGSAPIQNNPLLIVTALVLLAAFIALEIFTERRKRWPLVELSLFRRSAFSASALVSLLVGAALIIAMADIPIFIDTVLGKSAIYSGLALLRLTVMIPVGAMLGGWLCPRISCRVTALLGLCLAAIGFWLMHLWPLNVNELQITASTLTGGLGFGLVIAPIGTTAINAASQRQIGMASSVVTVLRMVGMILGLAALTSWGLGRFRTLVSAFVPPKGVPAFSPAYNKLYGNYVIGAAHDVYTSIFLAAGILCVIAIIPACLLEGKKLLLSPYLVRNTGILDSRETTDNDDLHITESSAFPLTGSEYHQSESETSIPHE
ncbi:MAG TPA: MFS transporter [Ktedonobacteraceae bacterium]|nr:MFS transporter [Ktedonobacteraceae bacterium]